jgi:hypothetical protein
MGGSEFYLIVHDNGKLHGGTFDRDDAIQRAALAGGVVVALPIISDWRGAPDPQPFIDAHGADAAAMDAAEMRGTRGSHPARG